MSTPLLTPAKAPARPSKSGNGVACDQEKKSFMGGGVFWLRLFIADSNIKAKMIDFLMPDV
jgi:hypothetical protein